MVNPDNNYLVCHNKLYGVLADIFIKIGLTENVEMVKNDIKALPKIEGVKKIMLPGEPEDDRKRERTANGIPFAPAVYHGLEAVCQRYGVCCDVLK